MPHGSFKNAMPQFLGDDPTVIDVFGTHSQQQFFAFENSNNIFVIFIYFLITVSKNNSINMKND